MKTRRGAASRAQTHWGGSHVLVLTASELPRIVELRKAAAACPDPKVIVVMPRNDGPARRVLFRFASYLARRSKSVAVLQGNLRNPAPAECAAGSWLAAGKQPRLIGQLKNLY